MAAARNPAIFSFVSITTTICKCSLQIHTKTHTRTATRTLTCTLYVSVSTLQHSFWHFSCTNFSQKDTKLTHRDRDTICCRYRYIHKLSIISVWPFSANRYTRCATTCCCIQQIQIQLNYAKVSFTGQQLLLMMIIMMLFDDQNSSNSHGFSAAAADEHFWFFKSLFFSLALNRLTPAVRNSSSFRF